MAFLFTRVKVDDYAEWKRVFDSDPYDARSSATGYRICRGVEDPNEVFIQVAFPSAEEAQRARQKLLDGGIRERFAEFTGPTVAEEAEAAAA